MKQGKNNEIDLLLRSLARDQRGGSLLHPDGVLVREQQGLSAHLDADELSSFAEGALPAPARTRLIAHLADCENCRSVVVSLTQASGAAARSETLEPQTGAGFWRKIASLFSPPVLRYAVPAIALSAVIAVSFFALRQQSRPDFVAKNETTNSAAPTFVAEQPAGSPLAQSNSEPPAKNRSTEEHGVKHDAFRDKKAPQDEKREAAKSSITTSDADTGTVSSSKSSAQPKSYIAGADRPVFAPEPQAAAPPPKPAVKEADKVTEEKEELAKRDVQALPDDERNQRRNEAGRHGPSRNNNSIGGAGRVDGLVLDGVESRAKSKKDSEEESELRTVSGRRFRHQGNAWIDTAYESSRRTINVSRGSEQFRALIADEPAIRTIAEKLSGVVIVVSNGRAYRIH